MLKLRFVLFTLVIVFSRSASADDVVVKDGDVSISRDELAYNVGAWTPQMRDSAIQDRGDRLELLNMVLANKKAARAAEQMVQEHHELYWQYQSGLQAYQRDFALRHYRDSLELPDFTDLARERYTVDKDKYALIPERRTSSQILIASPPGIPRDPALAEAAEVLKQLRSGADFVEMVKAHSDEPRAAEKQGKFDRWIKYGEIGVEPRYSEALFAIDKVGDYSEPVQTRFGVHIIRLDGIRDKSYKTFDEVKANIVKELSNEYVRLALKDFMSKFQMSDDVFIDNAAVEKILAPYANTAAAEAPAPRPAESAAGRQENQAPAAPPAGSEAVHEDRAPAANQE